MTGMNHNSLYPSDRVPQKVMVVGNNWFYIANIGYLNGTDMPLESGRTLKWSEAFTINPAVSMGTRRYVPLEKLMGDFREQLKADELGLFPLGEQREQEATMLGTSVKTRDDWYDIITRDGKKVKVFAVTPRFESATATVLDGRVVGLSTYDRNPFEN